MSSTLTLSEPVLAEGYRKRLPWRKLVTFLVAIFLGLSLSSCQAGNDTMGLDVVGYNHTDHDIGRFTVANGGGGYLGKHEGGGGFSCCASIPRLYKPGMTVTVRWGGVEVETQERVVEVPPYTPEDGGHFAVHFLRHGEIRVFVTMFALWNPHYPLKGDDAKL